MITSSVYKAIFSFVKFLAPKTGETQELRSYKENQKLDHAIPQRPITNQQSLSEMRYGASDVGKTGCEAVAIYNILLLRGMPCPLSDIIFTLQRAGTLVNEGKWGTNPYTIKRVLDYYHINNERIDNSEIADANMEVGDIFFVTVWNHRKNPFKGMHAYIVQKHQDNQYYIYNRFYLNRPEIVSSIEESLWGHRFIVGYLIKK